MLMWPRFRPVRSPPSTQTRVVCLIIGDNPPTGHSQITSKSAYGPTPQNGQRSSNEHGPMSQQPEQRNATA